MSNLDKFNAFVDKNAGYAMSLIWFFGNPYLIHKLHKDHRVAADILAGGWLFGSYGTLRDAYRKFKAKKAYEDIDLDKTAEHIQDLIERFKETLENEMNEMDDEDDE